MFKPELRPKIGFISVSYLIQTATCKYNLKQYGLISFSGICYLLNQWLDQLFPKIKVAGYYKFEQAKHIPISQRNPTVEELIIL
jgi:hypothetical protein